MMAGRVGRTHTGAGSAVLEEAAALAGAAMVSSDRFIPYVKALEAEGRRAESLAALRGGVDAAHQSLHVLTRQ